MAQMSAHELKIVNSTLVALSALSAPDCFEYEQKYYMVTDQTGSEKDADGNYTHQRVVNLRSAMLRSLPLDTMVVPLSLACIHLQYMS